jgi:ElaB/YqjD/DUF883 family membrane-anchored ribosome-binding protein
MNGTTLKAELDALRAELGRLRGPQPAAAAGEEPQTLPEELAKQIAELNGLVQQMLEDAEETISRHPVATVAGALALGIVIGRLTAR